MREKEWPEDSKDEKKMMPARHIGVLGMLSVAKLGGQH
jgi:hypothetical protein